MVKIINPNLYFFILISSIGIFSACVNDDTFKDNFTELRRRMLQDQIISRGVKDKKVLNAMLKVERHKFVPESVRQYAYEDYPLQIGLEQTISQPYIVALMTELLELKPDNRTLEIGTGSGYQAAILAEICKEVYTIEIIPELTHIAKKLLEGMGYKNIKVITGDGYKGLPEYAPFDRIIVTCAPEHIPEPLIEQLSEGGIMVLPVGTMYQELIVVKKVNGKITKQSIIPVRFVPMSGEIQKH